MSSEEGKHQDEIWARDLWEKEEIGIGSQCKVCCTFSSAAYSFLRVRISLFHTCFSQVFKRPVVSVEMTVKILKSGCIHHRLFYGCLDLEFKFSCFPVSEGNHVTPYNLRWNV